MRRLSGGDSVFAVVVAVTSIGSLLATSPLVGSDNSTWARSIIADTPQHVWASSHFGQVLDYLVLKALSWREPATTAIATMRLVSYAFGLLYITAIALLATGLPSRGRVAFFIIGVISPLTVFLHGEEEIAYYPFPVLILVMAIWRRTGGSHAGALDAVLTALGGVAAALHGVGLFFLPGIIGLGWRSGVTVQSLRDRIVVTLHSFLVFFGPSGVLFVLYILAFPAGSIVPGDAGGGGQRTLFVPLFGTIPAFNEFRAYSFFSLTHLQDVAMVMGMGAPALLTLGVAAIVARRTVIDQLRADGPLWGLAGCGILFVIFYYAGVSIFVTQSILVSALSVAQTLAAVTLLTADARPWRRSFPALLIVTVAATAFDWTHAGTNATRF